MGLTTIDVWLLIEGVTHDKNQRAFRNHTIVDRPGPRWQVGVLSGGVSQSASIHAVTMDRGEVCCARASWHRICTRLPGKRWAKLGCICQMSLKRP